MQWYFLSVLAQYVRVNAALRWNENKQPECDIPRYKCKMIVVLNLPLASLASISYWNRFQRCNSLRLRQTELEQEVTTLFPPCASIRTD